MCRGPIQSPQWLHGKAFVMGPPPGVGVQGPGMKDPFQLDKNALRSRQVQGTALSPGRGGGQWCQGRGAPVAPSAEPPASRCADRTVGIFAAIVPARRPLSPSRGELWVLAVTEDRTGPLLLSAQDSPLCSILSGRLSLCRWRCGCHGNIKMLRGRPGLPSMLSPLPACHPLSARAACHPFATCPCISALTLSSVTIR